MIPRSRSRLESHSLYSRTACWFSGRLGQIRHRLPNCLYPWQHTVRTMMKVSTPLSRSPMARIMGQLGQAQFHFSQDTDSTPINGLMLSHRRKGIRKSEENGAGRSAQCSLNAKTPPHEAVFNDGDQLSGRCVKLLSFSKQISSNSSVSGMMACLNVTVHGLVYAFGSSTVSSISRRP